MFIRKVFVLMVLPILIFSLIGCNGQYGSQTTIASYAADGLDLKAVGELLKTSKDAKELEQNLNKKDGVNNLDLDEDGKVDFIKVASDDQQGIRVMKLSAVLSGSGEVQDVATIEIEQKTKEKADVQIRGNEQVYGRNHYHHSSFGMTDALILYWLFRPGYTPYYSRWGRGNYPGYYGGGYAQQPVGNYRNRTNNMTRGSTYASSNTNRLSKQVTSTSTNSSSRVKAPLKSPTTSQRAFQSRNPSKQVSRSGGFGSRSTRSSSRSRSSSRGK